jgi:cytochrome c peroxidase
MTIRSLERARRRGIFVSLVTVALSACFAPGESTPTAPDYRWNLPQGFPKPHVPADNPMSEPKVRLGRYLFYDTRLSVNDSPSCASCHRQELAFTDGRATAIGATGEIHPRSAMSLVNVAYSGVLTWSDPNLRSLEKQALVPMFSEHPVELGLRGRVEILLRELRNDEVYRDAFPQAFPESQDPFKITNMTRALAAFERSIISARSPYDRYYFGNDAQAISEAAKRGEGVYFTEAVGACFRCHGGFNVSDANIDEGSGAVPFEFHNTGLYNLPGRFSYPEPNLGLYLHTHDLADVGKFKAPSLRNIALTAPYMHDGGVATLEDAIEHYASGGRGNPNQDPRLKQIRLTPQNRQDLLEFLHSLTDQEIIRDQRFSSPW